MPIVSLKERQELKAQMDAALERPTTFINLPVTTILSLLETIDDQEDEIRVKEREIQVLTDEVDSYASPES